MKIRIGIAGYGNLGRGVEAAVTNSEDMELVGVFTRRDPSALKTITGAPAFSFNDAKNMQDKIDVMVICGGSAKDLPTQTPELAQYFNVIDSFDTHAKIPEHFANVDAACQKTALAAILDAYDKNAAMPNISTVCSGGTSNQAEIERLKNELAVANSRLFAAETKIANAIKALE